MSGEQCRHQLVTKLHVAEWAAVLVPGAEQQREDVVASFGSAPALLDEPEDQTVGVGLLAPASTRGRRPRQGRHGPQRVRWLRAGSQEHRQRVSELSELVTPLKTEHDP